MTQRIALVTGGMGGIGTAVVKRLAGAGHKGVANCLPGYAQKEAWLAAMHGEGYTEVHAAEGDVSSYAAMQGMVADIEARVGVVDILVNNAGIYPHASLREITEEAGFTRFRRLPVDHAVNAFYEVRP